MHEKNQRFPSITATIFSDVHHGDYNYNIFTCTDGLKKLSYILEHSEESEFFINLGDMADYLKDETTLFYDQIADCLHAHNVEIYLPERPQCPPGARFVYNLLGNHEASWLPKKELAPYIPYAEGMGSFYSFVYGDMLFLALDANFDSETGQDDPQTIRRTPPFFHIPPAMREQAVSQAKKSIAAGTVRGIVWLSHIAFKDIDERSALALLYELHDLGLPLTIFEGHTHRETFYRLYAEDKRTPICDVHTLPAVTSGPYCAYYVVTFADGKVRKTERRETRLL